jgi:hypothetical protein
MFFRLVITGILLVWVALPSVATTPIERMGTRAAPLGSETLGPNAALAAVLLAYPLERAIELPEPSNFERAQISSVNIAPHKPTGFGRILAQYGLDGRFQASASTNAVRVRVRSPGASSLRLGIVFADSAQYEISAYRPGEAGLAVSVKRDALDRAGGGLVWTALSDSEEQEIVVRRLTPDENGWGFEIAKVSHIQREGQPSPLSIGLNGSAFCQVDIACVYAAASASFQPALLIAIESVVLLASTDSSGNTFFCTGTLLNSANYPAPFIYTAHHCLLDAAAQVSSLTTLWFWERDSCSTAPPSRAIQVAGGATVVSLNASLDAALVLLKNTPPVGAHYSGWDRNAIAAGTEILAMHHPAADVKKGSFGMMLGTNTSQMNYGEAGTFPPGTFYDVFWQVGATEQGSSGSGLFTYDASVVSYVTRGTLTGGNDSCTNRVSPAEYSKLDSFFPFVSTALTVKIVPGQLQMPSPVVFSPQQVGTQSAPKAITITNVGGTPVTVSNVSASDLVEFPGSTTCLTSIAAGASCQITLSFLPTAAGARGETITVTSNGLGSPQSFQVSGSATTLPSASNYQGLWFNPAESGWGINFAHQGDLIFASWFTYDLTGKGTWLVMTASKTAPNTYTGTLFQGTGPAFDAVPFPPLGSPGGATVSGLTGTGTITFSDANNATFAYTLAGISQAKTITRQLFGPQPVCTFGAQPNLALATNYTDLWWAMPGGSEAGWGINLTHQGDIIFASWFTFDRDHTPMWLVVQANKTAPGTYVGTQVYRLNGPAFNAVPFPPIGAPGGPTGVVVGTATFTFANGNAATFNYTVDGATQTKSITREVFTSPGTVCQ